jgi:lipopolysaccharide transport system permease protein
MLIIEANQVQTAYFKDLFRYRELFYFFAWRDIIVRYKQAFFGILWALIRPVLNMMVFTFLFGKLAHLPSNNINYSLFVLAGMVPWQLFSNSISEGCLSLISNAQLVSKIYFPKIIIPTAPIIVHLIDFFISTLLLTALALFFGSLHFSTLIFFPFFLLIVLCLTVGTNLWLSSLTVKYRDVRFLVPFFVQFGLFISPIGYGTFIIQDQWKWLYYLNPMVGIIDGFRWAFFGISHPDFVFSLSFSIVITLAILVSGFFYFRKVERSFADRI